MTPRTRIAFPGLLASHPYITGPDGLSQLLDDHQVLTADQSHRLLFEALTALAPAPRRGSALLHRHPHDHPTETVWLPDGTTTRVRLAALPNDQAQPVADNPDFDDDGFFVV
ncbi:hypothetical protein ABT336_04470 [Micromonospora sp. NPDC000207]|uniref:hypothetical protein n=1 Tax=Micromonospora sp. NPDC000207 TaxID=3154246 RepID=UPI0033324712